MEGQGLSRNRQASTGKSWILASYKIAVNVQVLRLERRYYSVLFLQQAFFWKEICKRRLLLFYFSAVVQDCRLRHAHLLIWDTFRQAYIQKNGGGHGLNTLAEYFGLRASKGEEDIIIDSEAKEGPTATCLRLLPLPGGLFPARRKTKFRPVHINKKAFFGITARFSHERAVKKDAVDPPQSL